MTKLILTFDEVRILLKLVKEKMKSFDKNNIEGQTELVPYNPLIKKLDEEYDSRMTLKLAQESDAQFG